MQISDKKVAYEIIKRVSGQSNILTIPRIYIDITGSVKSALFLSQCIYWADKMGRPFYKSYKDWEDEIGLSRWDIDIARKECSGIVTTELRKANGSPTLHYDVDWEKLYEGIEKIANGFARNSQMDLLETSKSLTETTTEITTIDTQENNFSLSPAEENVMRDSEELKKSTEEALFRSMTSPLIGYANYPERLRPVVEKMEKLWYFKAPVKAKKGGQYAFWVESCDEILIACGEFGVGLLDELYKDWRSYMETHNGLAPYTVSSPKSLINAVNGKAALLRSGNKLPLWKLNDVVQQSSRLDI